mgnify:FL=1
MDILDVVKNHICTGCGICCGMCPTGAIAMSRTCDGRLTPTINNSMCSNCRLCDRVCPQIQQSKRMNEVIKDSIEGFAQEGYLGRPADDSLYMLGQTCGLVRCLLIYALQSGYADRIVCVKDNPDDPLHPVIDVFTKAEQAEQVARSKYCPIDFGRAIKHICKKEGKCIIVGLGCHLQGLNKAMEINTLLRERVKLSIGLICDRVLRFGAADFLLRRAGVNRKDLHSFDYKDKHWKGYPGDVRILDKKGLVHDVDRKWRLGVMEYYTPLYCRLCMDKLNLLSDISVGDPWGVRLSKEVFSAVIARTEKGNEFLLQAKQAGKIILQTSGVKVIVQGQNIAAKLHNCIKYKMMMQKSGLDIPIILKKELFNHTRLKATYVDKMWFRFNLWTERSKGAEFLNYLPFWLVYLSITLKKIERFLIRAKGFINRRLMKLIGPNS